MFILCVDKISVVLFSKPSRHGISLLFKEAQWHVTCKELHCCHPRFVLSYHFLQYRVEWTDPRHRQDYQSIICYGTLKGREDQRKMCDIVGGTCWVSIIVSFYLTRSYSGACSVHTKHWIEAAKLQVCRQIDILNTSKTNKRRGSTHKHTVQCLFSNISNERQFTSFAMLIEAMPSSNLHELFIHFLLCVDVFWYILSHMSIYEYIT